MLSRECGARSAFFDIGLILAGRMIGIFHHDRSVFQCRNKIIFPKAGFRLHPEQGEQLFSCVGFIILHHIEQFLYGFGKAYAGRYLLKRLVQCDVDPFRHEKDQFAGTAFDMAVYKIPYKLCSLSL